MFEGFSSLNNTVKTIQTQLDSLSKNQLNLELSEIKAPPPIDFSTEYS